ncbi:transcriptional regulator [Desulfosporosinus sp. Tol-M]|jgi:Transcriptional regulators|nr:transcriptional regulator [Desulfosporosinus sp. Tol-M]
MDSTDRALLNAIQNHFPIAVHPYQILGKAVGTTEEDVFRRIQRFRQEGIIRRLGGVFDSRRLGYYSTLCTAKVPENKIPTLAKLLEGIPGVTHNYIRNHEYNVWFTLIARSQAVAESILQNIRVGLAVPEIYSLPAIRLFKINVNLDFDLLDKDRSQDVEKASVVDASLEDTDLDRPKPKDSSPYELNSEDIALIRVLQGNLPDSITPYNVLAENLHWQVNDLIFSANRLLEEKVMRRFGAVLRHQKAGFAANAMGVWQVEPEKAAGIGKVMARFKEVSHCYQRPTLPDWPYSLFTMIHGRTAQDCGDVMKRISLATGVQTYAMLFSTAELKKTSMQYFLEEETN